MTLKRFAIGAYCLGLVALLAPPSVAAVAEAAHKAAWALETFVDVTETDGRVLAVELRRPCGASVQSVTLAFCDEFSVSPPDCERLTAFLDGLTLERSRKLGSFTLNVDDRDRGTSRRLQIAIHEGDLEALDERMRYLCDRFELVGTSCPLLRRHLESQILELELARARSELPHASERARSSSIDRADDAYERIIAYLLSERHELRALVDAKASAYRRLRIDSKRESLTLSRRIRLLEADAARLDLRSHVPRPPRPVGDQGEASIWVHGGRAKRIPRVGAVNCSYSEYLRFARSSTPVIFTGFRDMPYSPGVPLWSFKTLISQCGQERVALKKSVFGAEADAYHTSLASQHYWAGMVPAPEATLASFLANLTTNSSYELYLHDVSIARMCPSLLEDLHVPRFFAEDRMQSVYSTYSDASVDFDDVGSQQRDYWPSLFIGGKATASSLHGDWGGTAAWMGLLEGRKHWVIASPAARAVLHEEVPTASSPAPGRFSADLMRRFVSEAGDVEWTDVLHQGELFEDVLEAGEVLFLPAECPHQVRNLETTIAVAANFVDSANAHHFAAFLRQEMLSSSKDKHQALARLVQDLESLETELLPTGAKNMPFHEFKQQQRRRSSHQTRP